MNTPKIIIKANGRLKGVYDRLDMASHYPGALGYALPPVVAASNYAGNEQRFPLSLWWAEETKAWQLPLEPVVGVRGSNEVATRSVMKHATGNGSFRGTVKEMWSVADYQITISGMLIGDDGYPDKDVMRLRAYCEGKKPVYVESPVLAPLRIGRIVITGYEFPHTKGENNQQYNITAVSDDDFDLLIKNTDL